MATKHSNINSRSPLNMCSREVKGRIKKIYLHYHNAYDHKFYQGGVTPQGVPTHKFS